MQKELEFTNWNALDWVALILMIILITISIILSIVQLVLFQDDGDFCRERVDDFYNSERISDDKINCCYNKITLKENKWQKELVCEGFVMEAGKCKT